MLEQTNWTHEFSRSFKNYHDLCQYLEVSPAPELEAVAKTYPLFIPRRLADKIKAQGLGGSLAREFLPHVFESDQEGLADPIGDKIFSVAPQIIHRYDNRVLFTPTSICPVHCRYCFRKNELNPNDELFHPDFEATMAYLKGHQEIQEIIFTGGDPLTLSNEKLAFYLSSFSSLEHVKHIRFHTRYPVILPERLDEGLTSIFKDYSDKFQTISLAIHANHVSEFDADTDRAITKLSHSGVQLLSQTVLLKGVNDSAQDLAQLIHHFLKLKIRPYYLHHPDRVKGGMHFYLKLETGRQLYASLRRTLPGWAIPQYVVDVPGGHGKIPAFNPESYAFSGRLISLKKDELSAQEPGF